MSVRAYVDAQRLDQSVRFERNYPTKATSGALIDDWRLVAECRAAVDGAKASGPEPFSDGGIRTLRDYTVWIRADVYTRFGLRPLDRAVWKTRILSVVDIPDQGLRGNLIALICRAGVNQG